MSAYYRKLSNALHDANDGFLSDECGDRQLSRPLLCVAYGVVVVAILCVTTLTFKFPTLMSSIGA